MPFGKKLMFSVLLLLAGAGSEELQAGIAPSGTSATRRPRETSERRSESMDRHTSTAQRVGRATSAVSTRSRRNWRSSSLSRSWQLSSVTLRSMITDRMRTVRVVVSPFAFR